MINQFIRKIYTINIKLFLWFWLVAIVSIFSTKFISEQLAEDVLILPPHPIDQQKLYHVANKIRKNKPKHLHLFINSLKNKSDAVLITKDIKTNLILPNSELFNDVYQYLEKNSFSNLTTIKLSNTRITGPIKISKGSKQLYIIHRDNKRRFAFLLRQLPYWMRIAIPVVISFLLCWLLARTLSKPISNMKNVANKFGNGDLSVRIKNTNKYNDELGDLAKTFNIMADKIQHNVESHQRLLGDVSHELRSPMTRLQVAIALAEKSKQQPKALTKHLTRCEIEVERLDSMIENVLSLSRLENSIQHTEFSTLHINEIIEPLIEDNQYLAEDRNIVIRSNITPCSIQGDITLLSSAINNVLLNAVKYSPDNSEVSLSVSIVNQKIEIHIDDQGSGVPNESLDSLFKPFYRTTEARERKTGGTGLGLAIAKQAINLHNGTIKAENLELSGLRIRIKLPLMS